MQISFDGVPKIPAFFSINVMLMVSAMQSGDPISTESKMGNALAPPSEHKRITVYNAFVIHSCTIRVLLPYQLELFCNCLDGFLEFANGMSCFTATGDNNEMTTKKFHRKNSGEKYQPSRNPNIS